MTERTEKKRHAARENKKKSKAPLNRLSDPKSLFHQAICAKTVVLDSESAASFKLVLSHFRDATAAIPRSPRALLAAFSDELERTRTAFTSAAATPEYRTAPTRRHRFG